MPKLHMRLSVELDVTEEQFTKIVEDARYHNSVCDVEFPQLPPIVQSDIEIMKFSPCDWDEGGYIPSSWLEYDMEESGLYECDENGVRRKEKS